MSLISAIIPMYRAADQAMLAIEALLRCELPPAQALEIIVVDDGSGDNGADQLELRFGAKIRLLRHSHNLGRVASRNEGARAARGEYLLFLDCDCIPAERGFLSAHLASLAAAEVSLGALQGDSQGFWHAYQALAARRREAWGSEYAALRLSAANVMLLRTSFVAVGGFDETYRGYGFEDRVLALRLQASGFRLRWTPLALVRHVDDLELSTVCAKMRAAAAGNGKLFAQQFPQAYRRLGYAAVDARIHPPLRIVRKLLKPALPGLIRWLAPRLERTRWPFTWRARAVKALVAASYLAGSGDAESVASKRP